MLIVYFGGTFLFTLASCSIIVSSNLPDIAFPEVIESISPSLQESDREIFNIIQEKLQEQQNNYLRRLEALSAACGPSNSDSEGVITYNVSSSTFRDPRLNMLVREMSSKLQDIAEITMDDLYKKLKNFSYILEQRFIEKFTPLISEIADLQNQVKNLAHKKALSQISSKVSNVVLSRGDEVSTVLSSLATKLDFTGKSSHLMEVFEGIQGKIEDNMKECENSFVIDGGLEMSKKLSGELAKIEESLRISSQTKDDEASNVTEDILQEMLLIAKKNGKDISTLSAATVDLESTFTGRLDMLNDVLEKTTNYVNSSFSSVTEKATAREHTHQLTDEKGVVSPLPCLDSRLVGRGRSLDICRAAVRFKKCYLDIVGFHCCRSCMDAGLISAAPSISASRNLSGLEALTFLRPS